METTQDNNIPAAGERRKRLPRWLVVLLVMILLGGSVSRANHQVGRNTVPVGFGHGLWHGAVMPCALPMLVLGQDIHIYAFNNSGRGYDVGYTLGVNLCGLLFFSLLFRRLSRWRGTRLPIEPGVPQSRSAGL